MDDWLDRKGSLVSVSDEEKKSLSNEDEQAEPSTSVSTGEETMTHANGERGEQNGEAGAGAGIIDSVASKLGVTIPGISTKEEGTQKEESGGGIINQLVSNLPVSEKDAPAADEVSLLISIIED